MAPITRRAPRPTMRPTVASVCLLNIFETRSRAVGQNTRYSMDEVPICSPSRDRSNGGGCGALPTLPRHSARGRAAPRTWRLRARPAFGVSNCALLLNAAVRLRRPTAGAVGAKCACHSQGQSCGRRRSAPRCRRRSTRPPGLGLVPSATSPPPSLASPLMSCSWIWATGVPSGEWGSRNGRHVPSQPQCPRGPRRVVGNGAGFISTGRVSGLPLHVYRQRKGGWGICARIPTPTSLSSIATAICTPATSRPSYMRAASGCT